MKLCEEGFDLDQEDDATGFLSIWMERDANTGLLKIDQNRLTDRLIETLGMDIGTVNAKATPAQHDHLVKDLEGQVARGNFNYASVVGMVLYLSGHLCPDISYAMNCCARYMLYPIQSHKEALTRIGRYLKTARERGLILDLKLAKNSMADVLQLDLYPDAGFFRYIWVQDTQWSC